MDREIQQLEEFIDDPRNVVGGMSFDEFCDWLDMGSKKDLECTLEKFESSKMDKGYITLIRYAINNKS